MRESFLNCFATLVALAWLGVIGLAIYHYGFFLTMGVLFCACIIGAILLSIFFKAIGLGND